MEGGLIQVCHQVGLEKPSNGLDLFPRCTLVRILEKMDIAELSSNMESALGQQIQPDGRSIPSPPRGGLGTGRLPGLPGSTAILTTMKISTCINNNNL